MGDMGDGATQENLLKHDMTLCREILEDAASDFGQMPAIFTAMNYPKEQIDSHVEELRAGGCLDKSTLRITLPGRALLAALRSEEEVQELRRAVGALVACLLHNYGMPLAGEAEQLGLEGRMGPADGGRFPRRAAEILKQYGKEVDHARGEDALA